MNTPLTIRVNVMENNLIIIHFLACIMYLTHIMIVATIMISTHV